MNAHRPTLGDTWTIRHGTRRGIQYRGQDGGLHPHVVQNRVSDVGAADLGDKYTDATQDAWKESHWTFGKAVLTKADALVAARWLLKLAAREATAEYAPSFEQQALRAAYFYDASTYGPADVIVSVIQATRKLAPRASGKAQGILAQVRRDAAAAPATHRKQKSYHREREVKFSPPAAEVTVPPAEGWMEVARKYAPWIGGGAAALVVLAIIFGGRKAPVRVAP